MPKNLITNSWFFYLAVTVTYLQHLNFVQATPTPKNDVILDGLLTEWPAQDLSSSSNSGLWGISWNSTCIFIAYSNPSVTAWDGTDNLILVFDLDPNINPTSGNVL